jgi:hypothetical protein
MIKDRGIVLRNIPYSDGARIVHCFTENNGLKALFTRTSMKRSAGHLQSGSFIEFTAQQKTAKDLLTLSDARWDPKIPSDILSPEASMLWLFAVEMMQKSLREHIVLPQLYHRLCTYFALLGQGEISLHPLVPLVTIAHEYGISDLNQVFEMGSRGPLSGLKLLGLGRTLHEGSQPQDQALFNVELDRFQQHFGIARLTSLEILL